MRPCQTARASHAFKALVRALVALNPSPGSRMREQVRAMDLRSEVHTDEGCFIAELSNIPEDADASIARARVPPGATTRWHRLKGTAERYVILSGTGRVEIGKLPPQDVAPNDVVLIPAGCRQRIACTSGEDLVFLAICTPRFRPEAYEDIDSAAAR